MTVEKKKRDRKEYNRQYRESHRDQVREQNKRYREQNREKINEKHREWYAKNPDKVKQYRENRTYSAATREKNRQRTRAWVEQQKEIDEEAYLKSHAEQTRKTRIKKAWLVNEYKYNKGCAVCGEREPTCLDFHHIDPSKKELENGALMKCSFSRIQEEISKCIVLCANCHRKEHQRIRYKEQKS